MHCLSGKFKMSTSFRLLITEQFFFFFLVANSQVATWYRVGGISFLFYSLPFYIPMYVHATRPKGQRVFNINCSTIFCNVIYKFMTTSTGAIC